MDFFEKLKTVGELNNLKDRVVVLKKDEIGLFLSYFLIDGTPINNRCLSVHSRKQKVGDVYWLDDMTCNGRCEVGNPHAKRRCSAALDWWTIEEPHTCACWSIQPIELHLSEFSVNFEKIEKLVKLINE